MRFAERLGWLYFPGVLLVPYLVFTLVDRHESAKCEDPHEPDCDLGLIFGALWALVAVAVFVAVVVAAELTIRALRQRRAHEERTRS